MSYLRTPIQTNPFTTAAYAPHERQNWDSIGPLTLSSGEVVHILVAICCHSRWTELWVTPDVSMESVKLPMIEHWNRFGEPSQILTDNGTQFVNSVVTDLCTMHDVQHVTVLAYSKEENSIVERINKEVMRHLRAFIYEMNTTQIDKLREMVHMVKRIINANRTEPNHTSPAQLIFGNAINLDRGILVSKTVNSDSQIRLSDWASDMLTAQGKLLAQAETLQREKDESHIAKANPSRTEYPIDSWVLAEYHSSIIRKGPPSKFNTQLRGPYKVLRNVLDHYTLWNTVTRKEEEIHISLLRPFLFDSNYVDPKEVAMKDAISTFTVESILRHEGNKRRVSSLDFLVRWQGYGEAEDLWLPWKELRDNSILHQYLAANNMKGLIPQSHR